MRELKTFGELSIGDRLFVKTKEEGGLYSLAVDSLRKSEYKKNYIEIKDDDGETHDLPSNETLFEEGDLTYSTDIDDYTKWNIPRWRSLIDAKEKKISALQVEIEEIKEAIRKVS